MTKSHSMEYGLYSNSEDKARMVGSLHQPETTNPLNPFEVWSNQSQEHFILQLKFYSHFRATRVRNDSNHAIYQA